MLLSLAVAAVFATSPSIASAATLFGTVSVQAVGQGISPEAGASVTVVDPQDDAVVAMASTALDGGYSVMVPSGIYDVRFDPASGDGFAPITIQAIQVEDSWSRDVVLVPVGMVRVSGVVRGTGGSVGDVAMDVACEGTGTTPEALTGSDGSYSFVVPPGRCTLAGYRNSGDEAWLPVSFAFGTTTFDLDADRTIDVSLPPASVLTVHVVGEDGLPVEGVTVAEQIYSHRAADWTSDGVSGAELASYGVNRSRLVGTTDAAGEVKLRVFDGSSTGGGGGEVIPPPGSGYWRKAIQSPAIDGDATLEVALDRQTVQLSGVVRGSGGPVPGVLVHLASEIGNNQDAVTGADGTYSFAAPPGRYSVEGYRAWGAETWLPRSFTFRTEPFDLSADRVVDASLASVSTLTVRVVDEDGSPVEGATVQTQVYASDAVDWFSGDLAGGALSLGLNGGPLYGVTDAAGEVRLQVFDGSSTSGGGVVIPPVGHEQQEIREPAVDGDTLLVVVLGPLDANAPTISCDPVSPGWHTVEIGIACTASDVGSGLADPGDASFSLTTSVGGHEDAAAQTNEHRVCDRARNCVTAGPIGPIAVDRAAPAIAFSQANDGANGWWVHSPATVHVTATDLNIGALTGCTIDGVAVRGLTIASGPTTRETDLTVRGEGRHTVACGATDTLGHAGSQAAPVPVDVRAPRAPTLSADRAPDYAATNWYADAVTVTTTGNGDPLLADGSPGSGVDPASLPVPQTYTTSGSHVTGARVADIAGHQSAQTRLTVKVDAAPPASALTCPAADVRRGGRASARWRDADGESGLAGPATGTIVLDTSTLGPHTASHTATDQVGHTATSTCVYTVA